MFQCPKARYPYLTDLCREILNVSLFLFPATLCLGNPPLSLKQIQELAISKAAQIRSNEALAQAENLRAQGAGLWPNPSAILQFGQVSSGGIDGATYDITLTQTVPFPGKLASRVAIQEIRAKIAQSTAEESRILVQHAVTLAAIRLANLAEVSKHSIERRRRYRLIHGYLKSHPQASPSQIIEEALIENEMRILEKGMIELSYEKESAAAELNFFLQLPIPPEVEFHWLNSIILPNPVTLESRLLVQNPNLSRKTLEVERAKSLVRVAKVDSWPDVNLSVNYRVERVVPQNQFYSVGVGFSLPLWEHGQYSIRAAELAEDAELTAREYTQARIHKDFDQAWKRVLVSQKELSIFPLSLVQELERKFDEAEREFRKGRISTSIFLATDSQVHETLDAIYESQYKLAQHLSQLFLLVGDELRI